MKRALLLLSLVACGGGTPEPKTVTVAAAAPTQTQTQSPPQTHPLTLKPSFEQHVAGEVRGIAVERGKLWVNVGGALRVFDKRGPVAPGAPAHALIVVGDGAFDSSSFEPYKSPVPKGWECQVIAFSADASRMSAYCFEPSGNDAVHLYDTRAGAEIGRFDDFHTAAPIRSGVITESGNFIFWSARASGAFEEIKSRVTGPMMSSHSVMSPAEDMLFTTMDKNWYAEDKTPARILDPKNGRTLFELGNDVDWAWFAPSGELFALHHSARWADLMKEHASTREWITIHATATDFARAEGDDSATAAFSRDGREVAVRGTSGTIRVYSIER